jgi:hypothetical protein
VEDLARQGGRLRVGGDSGAARHLAHHAARAVRAFGLARVAQVRASVIQDLNRTSVLITKSVATRWRAQQQQPQQLQ